MPLPWFFIDSMTAPEPLLRGTSSLVEKSILLVNTSLDSLRSVWVRFREASAKVRVSDVNSIELLTATKPDSSISNGLDAALVEVEGKGAATTIGVLLVIVGGAVLITKFESSFDTKPLSLLEDLHDDVVGLLPLKFGKEAELLFTISPAAAELLC